MIMKNLESIAKSQLQNIEILFTDIDDTITTDGQLKPTAFESLWELHKCKVQVVPVTGRPAGWCEMIARFWPVAGVVGENGAFYFRYHNKRMDRWFARNEDLRMKDRLQLDLLRKKIVTEVAGCQVSTDQFCRLFDLAIDFCEDVVPLPQNKIDQIVRIFKAAGAQAKVSSIHINGWFGEFDKLSTSKIFLREIFNLQFESAQSLIAFCGDSPNDEPMFGAFKNSFGVANIRRFEKELKNKPTYVCKGHSGEGFSELARAIVSAKNQ